MVNTRPARRKPRSLHRSLTAAHRAASQDARSSLIESGLFRRIAKLRRALRRIQPAISRAWRAAVERLRSSAEHATDQALCERLRRLELHELAVRDDGSGLSLRNRVFERVWPSVRDEVEDVLCDTADHLRTDVDSMRDNLEDVVNGHEWLDRHAEHLTEEGVFEPRDLQDLVALNWTIGARFDQARCVLKIGDWLLEALMRSRHDARAATCSDRRGWCCFFAQRAIAVLATSTGSWVCDLIDAQCEAEAIRAASVPISVNERPAPLAIASSAIPARAPSPELGDQIPASSPSARKPTTTTALKMVASTDVGPRNEHVDSTRTTVKKVSESESVSTGAPSQRKHRQERPTPAALVAELFEMGRLPEGELRRKPLAVALGERLGVSSRTIERCIQDAREAVTSSEPGLSVGIMLQWNDLTTRARPRLSPPARTHPFDDKRDGISLDDPSRAAT